MMSYVIATALVERLHMHMHSPRDGMDPEYRAGARLLGPSLLLSLSSVEAVFC